MWLKSHAEGSRHTRRAYERIGRRCAAAGSDSSDCHHRLTLASVTRRQSTWCPLAAGP